MQPVASSDTIFPGLHEGMVQTRVISSLDGDSGFFDTLLDIVNPLQHIPGVSTLYRAITGDQIAGPARLIGGALFGGPLGFASALTNLVVEEVSGRDLGDHALALLGDIGNAPEVIATPVQPAAQQAAATDSIPASAANIIWNGPRVVPSLARTAATNSDAEALPAPTATPAAAQIAANAVIADDVPEIIWPEIIWNGPRLVPPFTKAAAAPGAPDAAPEETAAATDRSGPRAPAWIGAALSDAQEVHDAVDLGQAAPRPTAKPWVADAMLQALAKYEAMARERNR